MNFQPGCLVLFRNESREQISLEFSLPLNKEVRPLRIMTVETSQDQVTLDFHAFIIITEELICRHFPYQTVLDLNLALLLPSCVTLGKLLQCSLPLNLCLQRLIVMQNLILMEDDIICHIIIVIIIMMMMIVNNNDEVTIFLLFKCFVVTKSFPLQNLMVEILMKTIILLSIFQR